MFEANFIKKKTTETLTPQGLPIAVGGAPSTPIQFTKGMPAGNVGIISFVLRVFGNLNLSTSSAGSVRALGGLDAILGITVQTDKHGKIVDNVEARSVVRMYCQFLLKQNIVNADVSAATTGTPTFDYEIPIPFALAEGRSSNGIERNFDTILDLGVAGGASPLVKLSVGDPSYFISGGTYTTETIQALNGELNPDWVENLLEPDPSKPQGQDGPSELPFYLMTLEQIRFNSPSSTGKQIMDLPYGDGRYVMIGLSERNTAAPYVEQSDMTVDNTDKLSLKIGSDVRIDAVMIKKLRDGNLRDFPLLSSMPPGWTVLNFFRSGRILDTLDTLNDPNPQGKTVRIEYEATGTIASRQLWVNMLKLKPLPRGALRNVQLQNASRYLPYIPA